MKRKNRKSKGRVNNMHDLNAKMRLLSKLRTKVINLHVEADNMERVLKVVEHEL